jgi:hypothetical protein
MSLLIWKLWMAILLFLISFYIFPISAQATTNSTELSIAADQGTISGNTTGANDKSAIEPKPLFPSSSEERTGKAFLISGAGIFSIFGFYLVIKGSKLIKDERGYPSLAKFQMLIWTMIIAFGFFGIYLTRIFGGILVPPPAISTNLLILMGITIVIAPVLNRRASEYRYGNAKANPKISMVTMLQENGETELTRVQMFSWTLISVFIYLILLYSTVLSKVDDVQNLILPEIDANLVVLMGLSQGGYLGGKVLLGRTTTRAVTSYMTHAQAGSKGKVPLPVTITGTNFGHMQGEIIYDNTQLSPVTQWTMNRIDVTIPYDIATPGMHTIKVITRKGVTEPMAFVLT